MKIEIKSDKKQTVVYRTLKFKVDDFIVNELYTNDVLTSQKWSVKGGFETKHPDAYEPKLMHFAYYENVDFLDSNQCCNYGNLFDNIIAKSTFILDWDKFNNLEKVLCNYLGMDGNIYRINDPNPIPLWRHKDYLGGFCNDKYDLQKLVKFFGNKTWMRNIEIVEIPYYNREKRRTHAVEFDYKLPSKKSLREKLVKNKLFENHYFEF